MAVARSRKKKVEPVDEAKIEPKVEPKVEAQTAAEPEAKKPAPKPRVKKAEPKAKFYRAVRGRLVHPFLGITFTVSTTGIPCPDDNWLKCQVEAGKITEVK